MRSLGKQNNDRDINISPTGDSRNKNAIDFIASLSYEERCSFILKLPFLYNLYGMYYFSHEIRVQIRASLLTWLLKMMNFSKKEEQL